MDFPASVEIKKLETVGELYPDRAKLWQTIQDLRDGAATLTQKIATYLPRRPAETEEIYALRCRKFSFTPVMSTSIRELTSKLAAAPVHVSGAIAPVWPDFFEAMDGETADQPEILNQIFSSLLYFGRVYVAVDLPDTLIHSRSAAEDPKQTPYLIIYPAISVVDEGQGWFKTRQVVTTSQPLGEPTKTVQWTFWAANGVHRYEAPLDKINLPNFKAKRTVALGTEGPRMISQTIPKEMWVANSVYLKQIQHLTIESSWTDAGSIAGLVQRVFTPSPPVPMDDPRVLHVEKPNLKADNAHVLVGGGFAFAESSGGAISNLTSQLETIEHQIRAIVSMSYASASKTAIAQSGASKSIDQSMMRDSMKSYGKRVAQFYQDVLQAVARVANTGEEISVQGLDTYSTDTLEDMVDTTTLMLPFSEAIPKTAQRLWLSKMAHLITGTTSPEDSDAITSELTTLTLPDIVKQIPLTQP